MTDKHLKHLWEANHPYYCQEGNYYSNECHFQYDSWDEFFGELGNSDPDYNLVFRWDWEKPNPDDFSEEEIVPEYDTLKIFIVGQRKARLTSAEVKVTEADENSVRLWLGERSKTLTAIWEPILNWA